MPQPRISPPKAQPLATLKAQGYQTSRPTTGIGLLGALAAHLAAQHQRQQQTSRTGTNAPDPYTQMQQRRGIGAFTVGGMQ